MLIFEISILEVLNKKQKFGLSLDSRLWNEK